MTTVDRPIRQPVFLDLPPEQANPQTAGVVMLPVPFERTSTYGQGSARGPAAIIAASREVELFDTVLGCEPYEAAGGIATLAPLQVVGCDGGEVAERLHHEVGRWLIKDSLVITLGGEHTAVVGAIRAHCEAYENVTVLQLDAHSDLRPQYDGDRWNHACAMARVLDFHDHLVQVGIRSQGKGERATAEERGLTVVPAHDIHQKDDDRADWIREVIDATRHNVYVTFDCDVMDPSLVPATGTPEPGGLTWRQIDALLRRLCLERNVVGFDLSELAPIEGLTFPEFTMAKLIYRFVGYRCQCRHRF